jgi:hypothetical protein
MAMELTYRGSRQAPKIDWAPIIVDLGAEDYLIFSSTEIIHLISLPSHSDQFVFVLNMYGVFWYYAH